MGGVGCRDLRLDRLQGVRERRLELLAIDGTVLRRIVAMITA